MQDHVSRKTRKKKKRVASKMTQHLLPKFDDLSSSLGSHRRREQTAKSCPLTPTYICPHTQHTHALTVNKKEVSKKQGTGFKEINQFTRIRQVIPESVPQTTAACRRVQGRREAGVRNSYTFTLERF